MRPFLTATAPFSITRRSLSIVTTVPLLMIRSTTIFLRCAIVDEVALEIKRIRRMIIVVFFNYARFSGKKDSPQRHGVLTEVHREKLRGSLCGLSGLCGERLVRINARGVSATSFLQKPCIERARQQVGNLQFLFLSAQIRKHDRRVLAKLPDDLPAGAARRR